MKKISIVVPFYNEEKMVDKFLTELNKVLDENNNYEYEIICVDDGSKDSTFSLLKEWSKANKRINIITFSRNFGHDPAINAGVGYCHGDAAIIMDADLQDPPSHIPELIKKWEDGYDVVNVKRIDRSSDTFFKRTTAKIFYKILSKWSGKIKIEPNVNNFRLISRKVIDVVKNLSEKNRIFRIEVPFAGFKTTYIELVRQERPDGESHYKLSNMNQLAIDSFVESTVKPLNIIYQSFIAVFVLFALSVAAEIILFSIQKGAGFLNISDIGYIAWLVVNVVTALTLLVLFALSLISQYIARIHIETQNRPNYIIKEIIGESEKK